jgi:hypothetical protein
VIARITRGGVKLGGLARIAHRGVVIAGVGFRRGLVEQPFGRAVRGLRGRARHYGRERKKDQRASKISVPPEPSALSQRGKSEEHARPSS